MLICQVCTQLKRSTYLCIRNNFLINLWKCLFTDTVSVHNILFTDRVSVDNILFTDSMKIINYYATKGISLSESADPWVILYYTVQHYTVVSNTVL